jgi:hypothetical protein
MRAAHHKTLFILAVIVLLSSPSTATAKEAATPKIASYRIDVVLDVETKRLSGKEKLTFFNSTQNSVDTLFFHLYPNAFSSDSTILMKESPFFDRIKGKEEYRGWMDIETIKTSSGLNLTDVRIINETIMKFPLEDPLPAGQSIELEMDFTVKLPQTLVRMGYLSRDFMIAQWFPKMAVLENEGGWNAHQYHFNGEFFADFGDYRVSITLPEEYVVGATGRLEEERVNADSTRTLVFRAEGVHDFAWAASPDYQTARRMVGVTEVTYYYKPDHQEGAEQILDYAEFALKYYGSLFGDYPYPGFTVVDAKIGRGGGAMEYPTLITISPSRFPSRSFHLDALIILHETAHQWWYGMVASNETEEAWLDEGFVEYCQRRALEERFGPQGNLVNLWWIKLSDIQITRIGYLSDPQTDPVVTKSWEFRDYLAYRSSVYLKASLILETLMNYLGTERMNRLLREYFNRYKFKHPRTEDFIRVVNEFAGEDTGEWLEGLLYGTGVCDYEMKSIESVPVVGGKEEPKRYVTRVELGRLGQVILPVEVEIELMDGNKIRQRWDGKQRWHRIEIETESKIKSATIDPESKIALEINVNNNSKTQESSDAVMMKLAGECLFWLENWLHWMTCF